MGRDYAAHEGDVNRLAQELIRFLDEEPIEAPYGANPAGGRFTAARSFAGLRAFAASQEDPQRLLEGDSEFTKALLDGGSFPLRGIEYWREIFVRDECVWWSDTIRAFTRVALTNLERSLAAAR